MSLEFENDIKSLIFQNRYNNKSSAEVKMCPYNGRG